MKLWYRKFASWFAFICVAALLTAILWALARPWGSLPPLGPLLSPYGGIWTTNHSVFENPSGEHLALIGLKAPVTVKVDKDQIKHIFAANDDDLYLAQGYVVASDRLWQIEFLSRLAGGRLSEMVGKKGIELDKMFIKLGIPDAAKESSQLMLQDSVTEKALTAFCRGVNSYIKSLKPSNLPFEYTLMGVQPSEYSPYKAALLLKFMAYNLAGSSWDLPLSRSFSALTPEDFNDLFPLGFKVPEPIVPRGTKFNFETHAPEPPKTVFHPNLEKVDPYPGPNPANGSNNWAVTGKKSTTGLPILSNDVHLGLTLPALWYEIQLVSPTQNVYGVTLPGSPGIILGFNKSLAWGVTNGGSDILDWYQLRYRDENRHEYVYDGNWRPVIAKEVQIPVRGSAPVNLTLRRTHIGPIVYDETEMPLNAQIPRGFAMHWGALEPSNEIKTFLLLNRATTTAECRKAIDSYDSPSQNFLCADNHNDVGLWHMGKFPIRWKGQGRLVADGTSTDYEWKGWVPRNELPSYRNPERGFLSSANQSPATENYPHYLGWPYENPFRGIRINEILREKSKFSPEDMVAMQGDTLAVSARMVLPTLLKNLNITRLSEVEKRALENLRGWDYRFTEDSAAAALYYTWYANVESHIWGGRFPDPKKYMRPTTWRTIELITNEPNSKWFDDPSTEKKENLGDVAEASFHEAMASVSEKMGSGNIERWSWAKFHPTNVGHLGKIPGLGDEGLVARGMEHTIFANNNAHGPAWKMVVALGTRPKAWGIYPGGQSGDPTSQHYDDFLKDWRSGRMRELIYLMTPSEIDSRLQSEWRLDSSTAH